MHDFWEGGLWYGLLKVVSCYVHVGGSGGIYFFLSFFLTLTLTTMDRVHRLPYGLVHGQPLQTPSRPLKTYIHSPSMGHPQNRIKIINRDFTHRLSNRLLLSAKFWMLHCANVTDLGLGSGASYIITCTQCHFCLSWVYMKDREASENPQYFELLPSPFVNPLWIRSGFTIWSAELQASSVP